jgi:hypothetical protein
LKNSTLILVAIILIVIVGGGVSLPKVDLSNLVPDLGGGARTDQVDVMKPMKFALTDKYGGSALTSKSLKIYDSDGATLLESLTTGADGTVTSAFTYPSGKKIHVKYESSNDKQWWDLTVPQMNEKDAEALSYNYIALQSFSIGTYTDTLKFSATTISDGGSYNFTASGVQQTFTYSLANTGNDNTGLISSYDPIYAMRWEPVVYITLSGTNYEKVLVYGMDWDFTLGTTHYLATELDAYTLTKHKVGNEYKSSGTVDITFSLDGTGYSGTGTTLQIYVYMYSDPQYTMNHGGNYGADKVELAEHTVTLQS